ncbi:HNH endonuclease [Anaerotignum sp. MB30-C6]|uniref:HNH endonuclease n=1 Tax=Anaerotignum sp. MB30-C6 TaxID=3070814 RepID=UPI0027DB6F79|nr:HNH endonuclease signature motif containing protein [Anaerotignum sp. MB30-C6]WMI81832.1 HNH endonuclease [Anaerotignum sp. MB30-C6]WMI81933.1 HNH endonuclease [Anaerotignum sp. MB30-C6]
MTEKQKRFADEYLIDLNATAAFKTHKFKYIDDPLEIIVNSIAVLIGDYSYVRKQACILLLKALLTDKFYHFLLEDKSLYPISRDDSRVVKWANNILSAGKCERCGNAEDLEAHHIVKWSDYPAGRLDEKNGMCLCLKCHTEEHKYDQSYHLMRGKLKRRKQKIKTNT